MPQELPALTTRGMLDMLRELGVTHVVWLPDGESGFLYQALAESPDLHLVPIAREGEAVAIATGLLAGGKRPVVIIQSTGFYESGDSLRGMAIDYHLPLLLLIGYRGYNPHGPTDDSAARFLEPILQAWELPYYLLLSDDDLELVRRAYQEARQRPGPVAVLLAREYQA
ncbi:MAG: hypothetical protein HY690_19300 [Chloroflexi bacterium]|nr:hypothetical protein [Chloroflexota bacterium]